jgi:predicted O-methyltransferase YrrM
MRFHHVVAPEGKGCVAAWNVAAAHATSHVMVQLSDDWTPPPMWDKLILERIGDVTEPVVLAVSDGTRKDDLMCMAICTHKYFEQDFFLFHPHFKSVYSDNWFTYVAYQRGCVKDAKDIVFHHQHPAFGKAPMDETYAQQNAPERYAQGKALFDELRQGKDWSSVPGFFNYWDFYDEVVARLKDGDTAVEVGSWFGRSIIYLAQALKRAGKKVKLYAVDSFAGELNQPAHEKIVAAHGGSIRAAFEANLKRCEVDDMVTVIEGDSAKSAEQFQDGLLAFCYIDAAHDYESVKRDVAAWRPKIASGGMLAGHDAQWHEVVKAVNEETKQPKFLGAVWSEAIP